MLIYASQAEAASPGQSVPFWGWEAGNPGHPVWVQRARGESREWEDARRHLRRAHEIALLPTVAGSPYVLSALDLVEAPDVFLVLEPADGTLDQELRAGPLDEGEAAALEYALHAALGVLHGLDLVHCDVREANVFRVDGSWRLGDLGGVTEAGEPMRVIQRDRSYVPHGVDRAAPADPANDLFAVDVVLDHVRLGLGKRH